jgi:hypothetical protein
VSDKSDKSDSGISDEKGSVGSGLMVEDVCHVCGDSTLNEGNWNSVWLCDVCEGEFHRSCVEESAAGGPAPAPAPAPAPPVRTTRSGKVISPTTKTASAAANSAAAAADATPWTCPLCIRDQIVFAGADFSITEDTRRRVTASASGPGDAGDPAPASAIGATAEPASATPTFCYSPARSLTRAWGECVDKGLMLVAQLLPPDIMLALTHGAMEKRSGKGRVVDRWLGAAHEIPSRIRNNCQGLMVRGSRFDLPLPQFVVDSLGLDLLLVPLLDRLRTIMWLSPTPEIRTHNVVFVPVGSPPQKWHTDDDVVKKRKGKRARRAEQDMPSGAGVVHPTADSAATPAVEADRVHRYFTILVNLNPIDELCGGTEVWSENLKQGDLVRGRPGDAFVFNGALLHRGQGNYGYSHRYFYYASFSCRQDVNVADK